MSKISEAAEELYPGVTYDTALPMFWVDKMMARGFDPRGHFVMLYPAQDPPYCAPITAEGMRMAHIVATYSA